MSKIKILVAEDDKPIRDMYLIRLKASGYEVLGAQDGVEALEISKKFRPELILLDLKMPRLNGQEMLLKLRESEWGNNILVIVLTNLSQNEASLDMRFLKVEKYIVKAHTTPKQVVEEMEAVLSRHNKSAAL